MESLSIKDPQKLSIKGNTNEGYGNSSAGKIINRFYMRRMTDLLTGKNDGIV